jgi:hypothetical protein
MVVDYPQACDANFTQAPSDVSDNRYYMRPVRVEYDHPISLSLREDRQT